MRSATWAPGSPSTARKADELAEAKSQLTARGIDVLTVTNDLARPEGIPALVDGVVAHFGTIDILVNNAGATWGAPAEDYPPEAWHKVMNLNVNAMFFLSQYVGKHVMIPKRSGKIINISSVAGLAGNPPGMATIAYNTSKGADINFTRALAAEWGRYNINVNAICPGFFPSKMSAGPARQAREDGDRDDAAAADRRRRGPDGNRRVPGLGGLAPCHGPVSRRRWRRELLLREQTR